MYAAMKASFMRPLCRLVLPIGQSEYFDNRYGTLEGSPNSPLNFGIFLNDLLTELAESGLGVYYGSGQHQKISALAYADDLVLIASNPESLQKEIKILETFCRNWRLNVNIGKTKTMVFKKHHLCRKTSVSCKYEGELIEQVSEYKYLGIILDETLSFKPCLEELGAASSRALGALITKIRNAGDIGYKSFDKLIRACVFSVMDYGAEVTGFRSLDCLDDVTNRAARYYMGVNKTCTLPCLNLEMGWLTNHRRRNLGVLRYYNRLLKMEAGRLPKEVFLNTKNSKQSWAGSLKALLDEIHLGHYWSSGSAIPKDIYQLMIREKCKDELRLAVNDRSKLRTYSSLYVALQPAPHIRGYITKGYRSLISRLRCGILQLRLETGRCRNELLQNRLCELCSTNQIESEVHFVLDCPFYAEERDEWFDRMGVTSSNCSLKYMCNHPFAFGKYLSRIWQKRTLALS